jgi:hypothetical protein
MKFAEFLERVEPKLLALDENIQKVQEFEKQLDTSLDKVIEAKKQEKWIEHVLSVLAKHTIATHPQMKLLKISFDGKYKPIFDGYYEFESLEEKLREVCRKIVLDYHPYSRNHIYYFDLEKHERNSTSSEIEELKKFTTLFCKIFLLPVKNGHMVCKIINHTFPMHKEIIAPIDKETIKSILLQNCSVSYDV